MSFCACSKDKVVINDEVEEVADVFLKTIDILYPQNHSNISMSYLVLAWKPIPFSVDDESQKEIKKLKYNIYLGESAESLSQIKEGYEGLEINIDGLINNKIYYWRLETIVDEVLVGSSVSSFVTKDYGEFAHSGQYVINGNIISGKAQSCDIVAFKQDLAIACDVKLYKENGDEVYSLIDAKEMSLVSGDIIISKYLLDIDILKVKVKYIYQDETKEEERYSGELIQECQLADDDSFVIGYHDRDYTKIMPFPVVAINDLEIYLIKKESSACFLTEDDDKGGIVITKFKESCNISILDIPNTLYGKSVVRIASKAFEDCDMLISIIIPSSVVEIEKYAFRFCQSLKEVHIPDSVIKIGHDAFSYCSSLESVNIPNRLPVIEKYLFAGCMSLKDVVIPSRVRHIEEQAFYFCKSLKSIVIPDGVISIGLEAFLTCYSLELVVIHKSVISLDNRVFSDTRKLKVVKVYALRPPLVKRESLAGISDFAKIYVPDSALEAYKNSEWNVRTGLIQALSSIE